MGQGWRGCDGGHVLGCCYAQRGGVLLPRVVRLCAFGVVGAWDGVGLAVNSVEAYVILIDGLIEKLIN